MKTQHNTSIVTSTTISTPFSKKSLKISWKNIILLSRNDSCALFNKTQPVLAYETTFLVNNYETEWLIPDFPSEKSEQIDNYVYHQQFIQVQKSDPKVADRNL